MSKSSRSVSLPARTLLVGEMKGNMNETKEEMKRGLKEKKISVKFKGTQRGRVKEKEIEIEIEEHFGISSLCFKTDLMTVVQRKVMMERQKNIAEINKTREIDCFSTLIQHLTCLWQEPGVTEVLYRLASQAAGLRLETRRLEKEAGRAR